MIKVKGIETYRDGGKGGNGTYQQIINEIPPHNTLVIPFLGNCAVLRHIKRPKSIIAVDKNPEIIKKWRKSGLSFMFYEADAINQLEYKDFGCSVGPETVIYCDPPYPKGARKTQKRLFKHELKDDEHKRLLTALKKQNCYVLISTYENDLYKTELSGWRTKKYVGTTRRGGAVEWLFMNYPKPEKLHDYSFLGDNFRERERIKRKINRTLKKFDNLPIVERNATIEKLLDKFNQ